MYTVIAWVNGYGWTEIGWFKYRYNAWVKATQLHNSDIRVKVRDEATGEYEYPS